MSLGPVPSDLWTRHVLTCRLPILQGGTFSFITPTLAILALPKWQCPTHKVPVMQLHNSTGPQHLESSDEVWMSRMREVSTRSLWHVDALYKLQLIPSCVGVHRSREPSWCLLCSRSSWASLGWLVLYSNTSDLWQSLPRSTLSACLCSSRLARSQEVTGESLPCESMLFPQSI